MPWRCCGEALVLNGDAAVVRVFSSQSVAFTEAPQARTSTAAERAAPLRGRCQCLTWTPIGSNLRAREQRAPHARPVRLDRDRVISGYFNQSCLGGPVSNVGGPVPPRPIAAYAPALAKVQS